MASATKVLVVGEDGNAAKVDSSGALEVGATLTPAGASAQLSRATLNITSATDTAVVGATAGQTIRVYQIVLTVAAANNLTFKSASTSIQGGPFAFPGPGSLTLDFNGEPWLVCTVAEALNLTTTTAAQVSGIVYYIKS